MYLVFVLFILSYALFYTGLSNLTTNGSGLTFWQAIGLPSVVTAASVTPAPFNPQVQPTTQTFLTAARNYNPTSIADNSGRQEPTSGTVPKGNLPKANPAQAKAFAKKAMGAFGWHSTQWPFLDMLWTSESGWRWDATNPNSGAYGIPQALPASKMATQGKNWQTNAAIQIIWGLKYIKQRYGSPQSAWAHEQAVGWY